jgi:hypothetical protein
VGCGQVLPTRGGRISSAARARKYAETRRGKALRHGPFRPSGRLVTIPIYTFRLYLLIVSALALPPLTPTARGPCRASRGPKDHRRPRLARLRPRLRRAAGGLGSPTRKAGTLTSVVCCLRSAALSPPRSRRAGARKPRDGLSLPWRGFHLRLMMPPGAASLCTVPFNNNAAHFPVF